MNFPRKSLWLAAMALAVASVAGPQTSRAASPEAAQIEALTLEVSQLRQSLEDTRVLLQQVRQDAAKVRAKMEERDAEQARRWAAERDALRREETALNREQLRLAQERQALGRAVRAESEKTEARNSPPADAIATTNIAPRTTGPLYNYDSSRSINSGYYSDPGYYTYPYDYYGGYYSSPFLYSPYYRPFYSPGYGIPFRRFDDGGRFGDGGGGGFHFHLTDRFGDGSVRINAGGHP